MYYRVVLYFNQKETWKGERKDWITDLDRRERKENVNMKKEAGRVDQTRTRPMLSTETTTRVEYK